MELGQAALSGTGMGRVGGLSGVEWGGVGLGACIGVQLNFSSTGL